MVHEQIKLRVYRDILYNNSQLASCIKRQTASILIRDNMIISTGYNGTPKGILNCKEGGCKHCDGNNSEKCLCVHSEENAIIQAAYNGISTKDSIMFCTHKPCNHCLMLLINAGIKQVYFINEFADSVYVDEKINPILYKSITLTKFE